jgi:hypothetical protein
MNSLRKRVRRTISILLLVPLLFLSRQAAADSAGWISQPPGSPSAAGACPSPAQWLLLYWQNPPKSIEDAARACPTADRFWAYEDGRWKGFTPGRPAASDAWLVPLGAAVFVHGGAAADLLGTELVGQTVRVPGSLGKGEIELTVTEVRNAVSLPTAFGTEQRARGIYLILFFRAVNTGAVNAELGIYSFYLVDGQGRAYTIGPATAVQAGVVDRYGRSGLYSPIPVGMPQDLAVAFDVPAATTGLKVRPGAGAGAGIQVTESGP